MKKTKKQILKKRTGEILLTLTGDVGDWIRQLADERGLTEKRGALQVIIHEKLTAQMRSSKARGSSRSAS